MYKSVLCSCWQYKMWLDAERAGHDVQQCKQATAACACHTKWIRVIGPQVAQTTGPIDEEDRRGHAMIFGNRSDDAPLAPSLKSKTSARLCSNVGRFWRSSDGCRHLFRPRWLRFAVCSADLCTGRDTSRLCRGNKDWVNREGGATLWTGVERVER